MNTPRYGVSKWPARDIDKLVQRDRQSKSQRARKEEISERREAETTALKAELELLTEEEKENRSERKERGMVHCPAVTVNQETQTEENEDPLGPVEDTRAGRSEKAAQPRQEDGFPSSLSSCSTKVSSESSEQSVGGSMSWDGLWCYSRGLAKEGPMDSVDVDGAPSFNTTSFCKVVPIVLVQSPTYFFSLPLLMPFMSITLSSTVLAWNPLDCVP